MQDPVGDFSQDDKDAPAMLTAGLQMFNPGFVRTRKLESVTDLTSLMIHVRELRPDFPANPEALDEFSQNRQIGCVFHGTCLLAARPKFTVRGCHRMTAYRLAIS